MVLQKRCGFKKEFRANTGGGYLVSAASGHVGVKPNGLPESPEEAMYREVSEELFSHNPHSWKITRLGNDFDYRPDYPGYEGGTQRISVFISESDGSDFSPKADEIGRLYPISVDELVGIAKDPSSLLTPDFREIIKRMLS